MKKIITLPILILFLLTPFDITAQENKNITDENFNHNPGRLFSVQTADVINSLDLSLLLGGSFGLENSEGFLGSLLFGLGGYGNVEINTTSILGSIFSKTENFTSIGLKLKLYQESRSFPGISVLLKTNNDWYNSINSEIQKNAPELAYFGLKQISYDTRITHLIISISKKMSDFGRAHLAFGLGDLRYKNLQSIFVDRIVVDKEIKKKNIFYLGLGIDLILSDITSLILEGQTIPYFKANPNSGLISPDVRKVYSGGLRVVVSKWLLLDSGFRYQDNYNGLADTEIKIGLQAFVNVAGKQ